MVPEPAELVVVAGPSVTVCPRIVAPPPPLERMRQMYIEVAVRLDVYLNTG